MSVVRTTTLAAAAFALAVAARPASGQALFEGQISVTLKSARGAQAMEMYLKDGVSRTEISGQNGNSMVMINDPVKKEMLMVMPERQMYMRRSTDMASMPMNPNMPPAAAATASKTNIAKTGKTETIAGIKCEVYTVTEESGDILETCLASGMGTFMMGGGMGGGIGGGMGGMGMGGGRGMGGGGQGSAPGAGGGRGGPPRQEMGWSRDLEKGMFPLRVTKNGENMLEVTKVEKKKLDAALFKAPEGFQEMNMGGGRGGRPPAE